MPILFCPTCGNKNAHAVNSSPNGGGLYVAEELEGCTEFYDDAIPYQCNDCTTQFYLGVDN